MKPAFFRIAIILLLCLLSSCSRKNPLKAYRYTPLPLPPPAQETWTWTKLNCPAPGPDVVVVDPHNGNTIFVGSGRDTGGVWKSTDGGNNFLTVWDQGAYSLAIDARNSEVIYATHGMSGVWRSKDGGNTWGQLTALYAGYVFQLDRFDSSYIYAGPWKSTDYGVTWVLSIPYLFSPDEVSGFDQSWQNPNVLYAGWHMNVGGRVYKSMDRGVNWTVAWEGRGAIFNVHAHPLTDQTVYVDRGYGSGDSLLRTTDGGNNWRSFAIGPGGVVLAVGLAVDPRPGLGNTIYAGGYINSPDSMRGVYRSTDGGESWDLIGLKGVPIWNLTVDLTASTNTTVIYAAADFNGAPTDGVYKGVMTRR